MKRRLHDDLMTIAKPSGVTAAQVTRWLRLGGWIALGTVGSLTLAIGAASVPLSGLLIRPRLKRLSQLKSSHLKNLISRSGLSYEEVMIRSFDDTRLYGWWMSAAADAPTVVVLHGVKKNRTDVVRTALVLRRAGFNVLMFDGRAHGHSEGRFVTYGFYERRDVETAIEWLITEKGIDKSRVGLAGESMGAAIALQVAAHNPWIRAVWADSPFASLKRVAEEYVRRVTGLPGAVLNPVMWTTVRVANYRGNFNLETINPFALAAQITCPVTLVHGTSDLMIATAHSEQIYDALGGEKQIWLVEGARHARASSHARSEYGARLTSFFNDKLRS